MTKTALRHFVVLVALLIPVIGESAAASTDPTPSTGSLPMDARLADDRVVEIVRDVAAHLGEKDPQDIEWVHAGDRNGPASLLAGEPTVVATPEENVPVVFVAARGSFVVPIPGAGDDVDIDQRPHPSLYLAIDEATGDILGQTVTEKVVDIAALGRVSAT